MLGASVPPVSANEKMLSSPKRFDRSSRIIESDTEVHVFTGSCVIREGTAHSLRVARLMREAQISAIRKRRRVLTTRRDVSHPVAPNLLNRDFMATEPNKKWVTDITYIPTTQGWLYLAVILDLYSRIIVGWSMSGNCDGELVENALTMALARRRPKAGLLHHSDRGSQYTSRAYQRLLEQSGIVGSMSRKGNCWDNAAMESFFGTLKEECVANTLYASHEEARLALFTYLEIYYNRIRRHSTLGYVSPLIYEQRGIAAD
jgi:putative transposase